MMEKSVRRVYAEKIREYDSEGGNLCNEFKEYLGIQNIDRVRVIHRYDIEGISLAAYNQARNTIFSEPPVDIVYDENLIFGEDELVFAWEYLPGQYDQRADSAAQAIQILTQDIKPLIRSATVFAISGKISDNDLSRIKNYIINPVDSREAYLEKPETLEEKYLVPDDVPIIDRFISMNEKELSYLLNEMELAMDLDDLKFCQIYFKDTEKRNPTLTEMRIIDTYWSDHCRHTTFLTEIDSIEFSDGPYRKVFESAYHDYLKKHNEIYSDKEKPVSLMDLATIAMKSSKKCR